MHETLAADIEVCVPLFPTLPNFGAFANLPNLGTTLEGACQSKRHTDVAVQWLELANEHYESEKKCTGMTRVPGIEMSIPSDSSNLVPGTAERTAVMEFWTASDFSFPVPNIVAPANHNRCFPSASTRVKQVYFCRL
jgi:hypothetical protein